MNATTIDLIALRMIIRNTRRNMADLRKEYLGIETHPSIAENDFKRYAKLMEKYQAWHIQKTGELYP